MSFICFGNQDLYRYRPSRLHTQETDEERKDQQIGTRHKKLTRIVAARIGVEKHRAKEKKS